MNGYVKQTLKRLRYWQPLNFAVTSILRGVLSAAGYESEFIIKHLHKVGRVKRELPNGRTLSLWSRADDWVTNQIFWRGWDGYESETTPLFFRLASRAQVTIDVGAYVGYYTLLAAHANPQGRVYAFEPMPDTYERLRKNIAMNSLSNVECFCKAVGEKEGAAKFFYTAGLLPCSSSLSFDFMQTASGLCVSDVDVLALDRFVSERELQRVDLIKIDTESTEPQVLLGMAETLRRDRPFIICEVLGRGSEQALEEILRPLGYRYYLITPKGLDLRARIEGHPVWLNYLFTPLGLEEIAVG